MKSWAFNSISPTPEFLIEELFTKTIGALQESWHGACRCWVWGAEPAQSRRESRRQSGLPEQSSASIETRGSSHEPERTVACCPILVSRNHLPELFNEEGLIEIRSYAHDETSALGDHDFAAKTMLWTEIIDNVASALQMSGFCGAALLDDARNAYEDWRKKALVKQTLSMKAVVAKVPTANAA